MFKALKPSSWGLRFIDVIAVLIVIAIVVKLVAPTSGIATAMHTMCSWLAVGITYLANLLARFLTWL